MHMAPEDGRPLQKELILVIAWRVEIGVLQADTLELREPDRQEWRVGFGITDGAVDVSGIVEEEPWVEATRQSGFQIAVKSPGIAASEISGRWGRLIRRKATNGPLLTVEEHFRTPDKTAVSGPAEGDIPIRNIDPAQVTLCLALDHDLGRVGIAHAHV